jgi:transposase
MTNLVNLNACGIDVSSKEHVVAVPKDKDEQPVRTFRSFTKDLHQLSLWLKKCDVEVIAMESTGVYWYHLYTVLVDYGFKVLLVNAYHVKNVPGRKSDVNDAQWLQQLLSFGLLNACFQPDNLTRELREYVRLRKQTIRSMSKETQHIQKALELMNIKLNNVIRDLNGKTGRAIIEKIISGERNPEELAKLKDRRIKASLETVKDSLEGNWRAEQLFNLEIAFEKLLFLEKQLEKVDLKSEIIIQKMASTEIEDKTIKKGRTQKNQPKFNVEQHLYNALGVDVTRIYGIKSTTALTIYSETGSNLKEKFPTEKQFLSWTNVVPNNKISGGKILSSKIKKKKNRVGEAFRAAANALWKAENPLGEYLRRKKAKRGSGQAIVATARKLASIYYQMVTKKIEFDPEKLKQNTSEELKRKAFFLEKQLEKINNLIIENQNIKQSVI